MPQTASAPLSGKQRRLYAPKRFVKARSSLSAPVHHLACHAVGHAVEVARLPDDPPDEEVFHEAFDLDHPPAFVVPLTGPRTDDGGVAPLEGGSSTKLSTWTIPRLHRALGLRVSGVSGPFRWELNEKHSLGCPGTLPRDSTPSLMRLPSALPLEELDKLATGSVERAMRGAEYVGRRVCDPKGWGGKPR